MLLLFRYGICSAASSRFESVLHKLDKNVNMQSDEFSDAIMGERGVFNHERQ